LSGGMSALLSESISTICGRFQGDPFTRRAFAGLENATN